MEYDKYIAKIDAHEMALRIAEAIMRVKRPQGYTSKDAMREMKKLEPDAVEAFYRAALAAAGYLEEAINDFQRVQ